MDRRRPTRQSGRSRKLRGPKIKACRTLQPEHIQLQHDRRDCRMVWISSVARAASSFWFAMTELSLCNAPRISRAWRFRPGTSSRNLPERAGPLRAISLQGPEQPRRRIAPDAVIGERAFAAERTAVLRMLWIACVTVDLAVVQDDADAARLSGRGGRWCGSLFRSLRFALAYKFVHTHSLRGIGDLRTNLDCTTWSNSQSALSS